LSEARSLIVGGMPGSGSSLLFKILSKYFYESYFESGFFCQNHHYKSSFILEPFKQKSKSIYKKLDFDKIFIEKTPENIFYFEDIFAKYDFNFIITKRNLYYSILSVLNRGNDFLTSIFLVLSSFVKINSFKINEVEIIDYEQIVDNSYINNLIKRLNLTKKNNSFNITNYHKTWNFNPNENITKLYYSSNYKLSFYLPKYFIKYKDKIFDSLGNLINENLSNFKIVLLNENQINLFLKERGFCLLKKI